MHNRIAITEEEVDTIRELYADHTTKEMEIITGIKLHRIYRIAVVGGLNQNRPKVRANHEGPRPKLPIAQLRTWCCPGKGKTCGRPLHIEPVFSEQGYSTKNWDLVCTVHHRFIMQFEDWEKFYDPKGGSDDKRRSIRKNI